MNYAQWENLAVFEAMRKMPNAISYLQAAASLAQFEPTLCEISEAISIG